MLSRFDQIERRLGDLETIAEVMFDELEDIRFTVDALQAAQTPLPSS